MAETSSLTKNTNYLNHLKTFIDVMASIVKESGLEPPKFHKHIKSLFSNYRNDLHEKELQDNGKIRITELIETELIERISHLPENLKMIYNPPLRNNSKYLVFCPYGFKGRIFRKFLTK